MPVIIEGEEYFTNSEVSDELKVSRQTLWRWREKGSIPAGLRYRTRQVLFKAEEVEDIRQFANRLVPIELGSGSVRQLDLFRRGSRQEEKS
jgi:predicted site-specific integrase-resolvase